MSSVCAEQQKLHLFSPKNKGSGGGLDIPPRKLLSRRQAAAASASYEAAASDRFSMDPLRGLEKFLPYNSGGGDGGSCLSDNCNSDDPYSSDHFRMYVFKVRRCTRSRSHDWTDCPFSHPGEKAERRDPRRYNYSGTICSEHRRGSCSRGDSCEFAHGVFECWLHPSRYRTEACKDGKNCKRKVCFFAHSQRELRILPFQADDSTVASLAEHHRSSRCCIYCHQHSSPLTSSSPTSTLMALPHLYSPPLSPPRQTSPPLSPMHHHRGLPLLSRYTGERIHESYKDIAVHEMMLSLDTMKIGDAPARTMPLATGGDNQMQFILSPAALSPASMPRVDRPFAFPDGGLGFLEDYEVKRDVGGGEEKQLVPASDPDLGWVNELLM
ncbi:hypothetical protein SAY87_020234 [Trapa incisa]|uniref:C3H1-type domain-containing protein n=1 Tax=Trapa incisa TaxID=236973 RepID=A0AAN7K725_9MYRT|nr:hypothetical protein SAY87_020234 [Trapa incisa]